MVSKAESEVECTQWSKTPRHVGNQNSKRHVLVQFHTAFVSCRHRPIRSFRCVSFRLFVANKYDLIWFEKFAAISNFWLTFVIYCQKYFGEAVLPPSPCNLSLTACFLILTFHTVVRQHTQSVVGFLTTSLLQIYDGIFEWKSFVNRWLRLERIVERSLWPHFLAHPAAPRFPLS